MSIEKVVVVGGGFGGLAAVRGLARAPVQVTLIDRRNHHLFQPLLYQVASAALAPSDIAEPLRAIFAGQANVEVVLGEVVDVDLAVRAVVLADGRRVPYDRLILAPGARSWWFGKNEWTEAAPGLKTLADALDIRRRVIGSFERAEWTTDLAERARLTTFVVVGGGPTGVEVAGSIREIAAGTMRRDFRHLDPAKTRVILVEAGDAVLAAFDPALRDAARRQLEGLGVEVWLKRKITAIDEVSATIDDERVPCATVIWAAGVRGSPLGEKLGVEVDRGGRVSVAADCSLPGNPDVFVIGDLASWSHGLERPLPGVAPVAISMGAHAAACVVGDIAGRARKPLRYFDKGNLATIGYNRAVMEFGPIKLSGFIAWLLWVFVHVMTLVGHRNRVIVFIKWAWAWLRADRSSRLLWTDGEAAAERHPMAARPPVIGPP